MWELLKKLFKLEFGSDLLAGVSIITASLLREYLVAAIVVLMLSGGKGLEEFAKSRVFSFLGIRFTKLIGWTSAVVGALAATPGRSSFGQDVLQTGAQQVHESSAFAPLSSSFLLIA